MTEYAVVPATMDHVMELAMTMRKVDRDEVIAQSGAHHAISLGATFGSAVEAWTGLADGEVICVFGVGEGDGFGVPWMMASDLVVLHQRKFLRHCRGCVEKMQDLFPVLENYVDVRNTTAISWLKWLGFDILETEPHGPYKLPFHKFRRVRK
jgi:hypothetical protein